LREGLPGNRSYGFEKEEGLYENRSYYFEEVVGLFKLRDIENKLICYKIYIIRHKST
jgi:hypothetical protein